MDSYAMDERILFGQLDLFHDFASLDVVPEKGSPVGVGDPERIVFPTDPV